MDWVLHGVEVVGVAIAYVILVLRTLLRCFLLVDSLFLDCFFLFWTVFLFCLFRLDSLNCFDLFCKVGRSRFSLLALVF